MARSNPMISPVNVSVSRSNCSRRSNVCFAFRICTPDFTGPGPGENGLNGVTIPRSCILNPPCYYDGRLVIVWVLPMLAKVLYDTRCWGTSFDFMVFLCIVDAVRRVTQPNMTGIDLSIVTGNSLRNDQYEF